MPQTIFILPDGYRLSSKIDLKTDVRLALILNAAALVLTVASFACLVPLIAALRRIPLQASFSLTIDLQTFVLLLLITAFIGGGILVHETIHGIFFWLFNRRRPAFGLGFSYAYAAAPGCYIPRWPYVVIGLAPLVLIDLAALALLLVLPTDWIIPLALLVAFNTGGSIGDLWIVWRLLCHSERTLVHDDGHSIRFYEPAGLPGIP